MLSSVDASSLFSPGFWWNATRDAGQRDGSEDMGEWDSNLWPAMVLGCGRRDRRSRDDGRDFNVTCHLPLSFY